MSNSSYQTMRNFQFSQIFTFNVRLLDSILIDFQKNNFCKFCRNFKYYFWDVFYVCNVRDILFFSIFTFAPKILDR